MSDIDVDTTDANDEDIADVMRSMAYIVDESRGVASVIMLAGEIFIEAADEIDRLRAAGDTLAAAARTRGIDDALDAWDAVRGRKIS